MRLTSIAAAFLVAGFVSSAPAAESVCIDAKSLFSRDGYISPEHRLDPNNHHHNQHMILQHAKGMGLPVFLISAPAGENLPVILLNKHTSQAWSPFLQQTFGLNQSLHGGNAANHGWARLPGRLDFDRTENMAGSLYEGGTPEGVLVDLYSPAQSQGQAINGNGYRWKFMAEYFKRRHKESFVHIEQAFALSREDQIKMWLYHSAKRSALVRVQYMFDTHNNDWIRSQRRVLQQDGVFNRRGCGEHCNNSRAGATAINHAQEMRGRLSQFFNKDVNDIYGRDETRRFLDDGKKKLLYLDWRTPEQLRPDLLNEDHLLNLMRPHFREGLSREQQVDAISYLLAVQIFEEAAGVKEKYQMDEEVAMTFGNPKMSALIVYSDLPDSPELFYQGRFEYWGANGAGFSSAWPGLNPRPIFDPWPANWWEKWRPQP